MMSWVFDKFDAIPYLRFLGEPATGKTRCLQVVGHLSYKGISASGATTASPLFRLLDVCHGTFLLDKADHKNSDMWVDIIKMLNNGYMRGMFVLRSDKSGDSYEPRAFDVYGPKILSTRREFEDRALETRCLTLRTSERKVRPDIPRQLPEAFYDEALELRNKLLRWRFENYARIECDESELLHLEPRLTQIGVPLYSVSRDPGFRARFLKFLADQADEQRDARPQGVIVEAIRQLVEMGKRKLPTVLGVKDVAEQANLVTLPDDPEAATWPPEVKFTARGAGPLLRVLGFVPERTRRGYEFELTEEVWKNLDERYPRVT